MGDAPQNDMAKLGVFSFPGSIDVGAPYVAVQDQKPERWKGKQMLSGGTKWGTNPDAMIDKTFKRLSEGERYVQPGKHEREYALAQQAKRTGKAFYPPKTSKGLIGDPYPNMNDDERQAEKQPPAPRGIFTNPAKKGCVGTPGLTLGRGEPPRPT